MFKRIFKSKKEISPDQLGKYLYQAIQLGLSSRSELSIDLLLTRLELAENDLILEYQTEVILALMYQAILAVDNKYNFPVAGYIINGMTKEFLSHTKEMGATDNQLTSFLSLFEVRTKEYADAEKNKTLDGPAYWIGKSFMENLTGAEQDILDPITPINFAICSEFLTASLVGIDSVLKKIKIKE